jgi:hypothetical protein
MSKWLGALPLLALLASVGCGAAGQGSPPPPCDQACRDATALRSVREMMKLMYNLTLQGRPVGAQDVQGPCPLGGTAHVFGTATSNALQGSTDVTLTYVLDHCAYMVEAADPTQTYDVTVSGTIQEQGTLAVQPSSTTAVEIACPSIDISGTVEAPPVSYQASGCPLVAGQSGSQLSGTICGRPAGLTL